MRVTGTLAEEPPRELKAFLVEAAERFGGLAGQAAFPLKFKFAIETGNRILDVAINGLAVRCGECSLVELAPLVTLRMAAAAPETLRSEATVTLDLHPYAEEVGFIVPSLAAAPVELAARAVEAAFAYAALRSGLIKPGSFAVTIGKGRALARVAEELERVLASLASGGAAAEALARVLEESFRDAAKILAPIVKVFQDAVEYVRRLPGPDELKDAYIRAYAGAAKTLDYAVHTAFKIADEAKRITEAARRAPERARDAAIEAIDNAKDLLRNLEDDLKKLRHHVTFIQTALYTMNLKKRRTLR